MNSPVIERSLKQTKLRRSETYFARYVLKKKLYNKVRLDYSHLFPITNHLWILSTGNFKKCFPKELEIRSL